MQISRQLSLCLIFPLALGAHAHAQSDPFQAVRPSAPAAQEAPRAAPQEGTRVAPPRGQRAPRQPSRNAEPPSQDGIWAGRLLCDPMPEANLGRQSYAFTLTVSDGMATYQREVVLVRVADGAEVKGPQQFERGAGRIGDDGNVILSGQLTTDNTSIQASYRGRLVGDSLSLEGQQMLTADAVGRTVTRRCAGTLSRS